MSRGTELPASASSSLGPKRRKGQKVPLWPAMLVAAAAILTSITLKIGDPDIGQHLVVGSSIWAARAVRGIHLWSWPLYGRPEVTESWAYCAMIYPLWEHFGVWGLFLWQWATTLVGFGLLFLTGRRMGANPVLLLVVLVWCSLIYRGRGALRPESLAAVLLALELFVLETRRLGSKDRSFLLVPILWMWANANLSYLFGFLVLGAYLLDDALSRRSRAGRRATRSLAWVALASAAAAFVGPLGWKTLALPFKYVLFWRREVIFQSISELAPINWSAHRTDGLALLMAGWVLLAAWRTLRRGIDAPELVVCGAALIQSLISQRFVSTFALVASIHLARDISEYVPGLTAWLERRHAGALNLAVAAFCMWSIIPEWTTRGVSFGVGWDLRLYPVKAADFMSVHGVRGRGFSYFWTSGYLLRRFWPDTSRLPFMDVHQFGSREDRDLQTLAQRDPGSWHRLDDKYRFEYVLLLHDPRTVPTLPDFLDRDSTWAMVFNDDAAVLYVRKAAMPELARRVSYHVLRGSDPGMNEALARCAGDASTRAKLREEAGRERASSPYAVRAETLLGVLAAMDGEFASAADHLREALRIDPAAPRVHEKLGLLALAQRKFDEAEREFRTEYARFHWKGWDFRMGQVYAGRGDLERAAAAYERELERQPGNPEILDSLEAVRRRLGRRPS